MMQTAVTRTYDVAQSAMTGRQVVSLPDIYTVDFVAKPRYESLSKSGVTL